MSVPSLGQNRFVIGVSFAVVLAIMLLELPSAPEAPGQALSPEKKKDKYDRAIEQGLKWLALHQAEDGRWSLHGFPNHAREKPLPNGKVFTCDCVADAKARSDIAATAFGLLPFLAAGYEPKPSNKKPDYSKTVETGLKYLLTKQEKNGTFGTNDMYAHGLAARTLCDAYALTKDDKLKEPAQKALDFIVEAQDPEGGGWRYTPRQPGDLSVTGWHFVALKRGQLAGLTVPRKTLKKVEQFLDSCETDAKGSFSYIPGQKATPSMTAVGSLCRWYTGVGPKNPALRNGVLMLKDNPPEKRPDIYYLYYATQVMHLMKDESWRFWNAGVDENGHKKFKGVRDFLLLWQDDGDTAMHPHQKGSWSGSHGGRVMATSLALLILQEKDQLIHRR